MMQEAEVCVVTPRFVFRVFKSNLLEKGRQGYLLKVWNAGKWG